MSLSSLSFINCSSLYSKLVIDSYVNQILTSVAFTSNTRTDSNYGLITVTTSATSGDSTTYGIIKMLDNNTTTQWQSISSDFNTYYNEANVSTSLANGYTGGEYSDSNNTIYAAGSGYYYGIKVSGIQTRFATTYLDDVGASQTAYGAYINVFFGSTIKATLKNFTIGGNTSYNWDDVPRDILIVGSNDGTNWNLIQDASNFGDLSPWSSYYGITAANGYKNGSGVSIPYSTSTYTVSTTSKYRYLRFIIRRLIRERVLGLFTFNLTYDIYLN